MKVLITGANGFLGKKLVKIFAEKGTEVIATEKAKKTKLTSLDVTDKKSVEAAVKKLRPDIVVHAAAVTAVDWCEMHAEETFFVNTHGTENVVQACKKFGSKMFLVSTDYVFDGTKKGKYTESDPTGPVNIYAQSKLEAERVVQKELEDFLIGRVTVLYGFNDAGDKKTFPVQVIEALSQKKEFICFAEQYSNPTLINDIAEAIFALIGKNLSGVYHMTGSENLNRLDFAKKVAKVFNLDEGLLRAGRWGDLATIGKGIAKRPLMLDISIKKLEKEGIKMSNAFDGLKKMKQDMQMV